MTERNEEILKILEETYQGTTTALEYATPFELLVATVLSAQTNDNQVNKITRELFQKYHTPEEFARLETAALEKEIKTCGLYKNKAKNIIAAAKIIVKEHQGILPTNREELMKLPGVGQKTANVILSNAFGIPAFAVDTHVFRVAHRLGLSSAKTPEATEDELTGMIPREKWGDAHHWFIWHGRRICSALKPKCDLCPVADLCISKDNGEEN